MSIASTSCSPTPEPQDAVHVCWPVDPQDTTNAAASAADQPRTPISKHAEDGPMELEIVNQPATMGQAMDEASIAVQTQGASEVDLWVACTGVSSGQPVSEVLHQVLASSEGVNTDEDPGTSDEHLIAMLAGCATVPSVATAVALIESSGVQSSPVEKDLLPLDFFENPLGETFDPVGGFWRPEDLGI